MGETKMMEKWEIFPWIFKNKNIKITKDAFYIEDLYGKEKNAPKLPRGFLGKVIFNAATRGARKVEVTIEEEEYERLKKCGFNVVMQYNGNALISW